MWGCFSELQAHKVFRVIFGSRFINDMNKNLFPLSPADAISHTIHCLIKAE